MFRVLRKCASERNADFPESLILSGRFGLISGKCVIPAYDHLLSDRDQRLLMPLVSDQLKETLDEVKPERIFVSVGRVY